MGREVGKVLVIDYITPLFSGIIAAPFFRHRKIKNEERRKKYEKKNFRTLYMYVSDCNCNTCSGKYQ